jgi:uncharacterized protein YndB with AHSA1/START domain
MNAKASPAADETIDLNVVRKTLTVAAPQAVAFRVFTEQMSLWWPLATHHIGKADAKEVKIEPGVGGRCLERGIDGSECVWGHVRTWNPPAHLVFSWEISADWQIDPTGATEVEVRFIAESSHRTRVELEHRNLDRFGVRRDEMRAAFDSKEGWTGLLELFARAASAQPG